MPFDGGTAYWATNDLGMTDLTRLQFAEFSRAIEHDHRWLKQCTGVERCQCRSARAQRNHIGLALRVPAVRGPLLRHRGQLGRSQDGDHS
ncbi:hypothetical protein C1280_00400 [Gemmata obscuriglobus]|uniref:DDE domain-containing protein n=1 Tax=Gemmata obscuriglobus TaxID=114 RepID=A0A2Z3GU94_9BACT|nr:hypothetical protein C1280_00400 [Gemmata obscuriglobus]